MLFIRQAFKKPAYVDVHGAVTDLQLSIDPMTWGLAAIRSRINRAEYPPLPAEAQRVAKLCCEILQVEQDVMASKGVEADQEITRFFVCLYMYVISRLIMFDLVWGVIILLFFSLGRCLNWWSF